MDDILKIQFKENMNYSKVSYYFKIKTNNCYKYLFACNKESVSKIQTFSSNNNIQQLRFYSRDEFRDLCCQIKFTICLYIIAQS